MKTRLLLFCISVLYTLNVFSQRVININNTYTSDNEITISDTIPSFYAFRVQCNSTLQTDSSIVRLILKDKDGNESLIFENYFLINNSHFSNVNNYGEETFYLPSTGGLSVIIQVVQGSVYINKFEYYTVPFNNFDTLLTTHIDSLANLKVSAMNNIVKEKQMLWFAGKNSFSTLKYFQKKSIYGDKYNLEGLDFYNGGVFIKMSQINNTNKSIDTLVEDFDWRKKHNANSSSSPYFDSDPDSMYCWWNDTAGVTHQGWVREHGNGWLTGTRNQLYFGNCVKGCYAFATVATVEAVTNLYFNKHRNVKLSEQEAISCGNYYLGSGDCFNGGQSDKVANYIKTYGISSEGCFNWADDMVPCSNKCSPPPYNLKIQDYTAFFPGNIHQDVTTNSDKKRLKEDLINYGPHHVATHAVNSSGGHSMCLMGWGKVKEGQIFKRQWDQIVVSSGNPLIGSNYWIFKNSAGPIDGDNGYNYFIDTYDVNGRLFWTFRITTPIIGLTDTIRCVDLDGDGYYNWGIGPKPITCPTCPIEEDCNDADPFMGPSDNNYVCTCNCDLFTYSSIPLQITQNVIWNDYKYINKDIIINSGATLSIGAKIGFQKDSKIIVQNGGNLILNDGCVLTSICDTTWYGIIVNGGGKLITNNRSKILLTDKGKIFINSDVNGAGLFIFNKGSYVLLDDDSSYIDLKGNLSIGDSATFTFSGKGYIRMRNTQVASNYCNITCGTNSAITLNGTGITDKILEIDQEAFYTPTSTNNPADLTTLRITNGLVDMKSATAMVGLNGNNTALYLDYVKFTPYSSSTRVSTIRGVQVYGQTSIHINHCTFEKSGYGIYGWLSYSYGAPFSVTNCIFENNQFGIFVHDKSVQLSYCTFNNNQNGFNAEYTSFDNNMIDHCTFGTNNYNPVRYVNCAGDVMMQHSNINYAYTYAVYATGSHYFNMLCSTISGVASTAGNCVFLQNGPTLNMSSGSTPLTGTCSLTARFPIRVINALDINLLNGYNYINRSTGTLNIYGTLSRVACGSLPTNPPLDARYNQWVPTTPLFNITKVGCTNAYLINSANPITYYFCGGAFAPQVGGSNTLTMSNPSYSSGTTALQSAESSGDWHTPFVSFGQVLAGTIPSYTSVNISLWENSWKNMKHCLKQMYVANQLNGTNNSEFIQTITANSKIKQLQINNYYRKFQIELEKATLYRMAGDYNTAITLLTTLTSDTSDTNKEQAESWLCIVQLEKQISEGTISPSEIEKARANCPTYSELTTKGMEVEQKEEVIESLQNNLDTPWLYAMPNPINESSVIAVNTAIENESIIEITNISGILIKSIKITGGYSEVKIPRSELSIGIYNISLLENGKKVAVSKMTVLE